MEVIKTQLNSGIPKWDRFSMVERDERDCNHLPMASVENVY
jgi:hypothetical protein